MLEPFLPNDITNYQDDGKGEVLDKLADNTAGRSCKYLAGSH